MKKVLVTVGLVLGLTACSDEVSFSTQEQMRGIAKENAEFNVRKFKADNARYSNLNHYNRGDSTIGPGCQQGDGWVSVDLLNDRGQPVVKLKCSSVSLNIGCMTKEDFGPRYGDQDGTCNSDIPQTLPKLVK